jgi:hypothetical protein
MCCRGYEWEECRENYTTASVSFFNFALRAPSISIFTAGTHRALDIARNARWVGEFEGEQQAHIDPLLLPYLDVILVHDVKTPLSNLTNATRYLTIEGKHMCHKRLHKVGGWTVVNVIFGLRWC